MTLETRDIAAQGAPLEYWFIKLHAGGLAFLVDFILRRTDGTAEIRVSLWVRGQGRVIHRRVDRWQADGAGVTIGEGVFAPDGTRGAANEVQWDLHFRPGPLRLRPAIPLLSGLHPMDLELVSYPWAVFDGRVVVAGESFPVPEVTGTLTHYWGRRLPDSWRWVSARGSNRSGTDIAVESVLMRTRIWGSRPALPAGYLWIGNPDGGTLLVSPVNALVTARGSAADFVLLARSLRGSIEVACSARPDDFNELGEGIHQTLQGSCAIPRWGWACAAAGLEYRNL